MLNITELLDQASKADTMGKAVIVSKLNAHYEELVHKQQQLETLTGLMQGGTTTTIQITSGSSSPLLLDATSDVMTAFATNIKTALTATQSAVATILAGGPYSTSSAATPTK